MGLMNILKKKDKKKPKKLTLKNAMDKDLEDKLIGAGFTKKYKMFYKNGNDYVLTYKNEVNFLKDFNKKDAAKTYDAMKLKYDLGGMSKAAMSAMSLPGGALGGGVVAYFIVTAGYPPVWGAVAIGAPVIATMTDLITSVFREEKKRKKADKLLDDYKKDGKLFSGKDAYKQIEKYVPTKVVCPRPMNQK